MVKELILSAIILIMIFIGNSVTANYTKLSVEDTSNRLIQLKDNLNEENVDEDEVKNKIEEIHNQWDKKYEVLAYYLEHTELEKIETELTDVRARIKIDEFDEAIPEIDKCIFLLRHVKEKNEFTLKNIF